MRVRQNRLVRRDLRAPRRSVPRGSSRPIVVTFAPWTAPLSIPRLAGSRQFPLGSAPLITSLVVEAQRRSGSKFFAIVRDTEHRLLGGFFAYLLGQDA